MTLEETLGKLVGVKQSGDEWKALCPAHDDKQASLTIREKDGKILLHCHAGCTYQAITAVIGGTLSGKRPTDPTAKPNIVKVYDYTDSEGRLLYQAVRYQPKDFRQRRPDGNGGYIWNLNGVIRVLYRLPAVLTSIEAHSPVYVCEGEKDCHSLESIGLCATCNAGGAEKWQAEYSDSLQGADVIILPDNDGPGRKHAEQVARSLKGKAQSIRILELPGLPAKGDVSDWIAAGGTAVQLLELVENCPEWVEPQTDEAKASTGPTGYPYTDLGNAERLIASHGENLRYDVNCGHWLLWQDGHWKPDITDGVHRLACDVVRGLYVLLGSCPTKEASDELYRHIRRSESAPRLAAMTDLARRRAGIPVQSSDLDTDPWLLCCKNGTVDLKTGKLQPHRQADLCTKQTPIIYDPAANCPRWLRFLEEVFCEDAEIIGFVQRMTGYMLTADTREQAFFLLTGKGSNGKSVFVSTLTRLLGDYTRNTPAATFLDKQNDQTNALASLVGMRLVTATEGEDTTAFSESLLKRVTGEDVISARFLYKESFDYTPSFKVLFATNEVPRIHSQNYAMKRRVKLIPFRVRFYYAHEQKAPVRDETLAEKLREELPGILAWAVRGCLDWQEGGLGMPGTVQAEVDSLFDSMDVLAEFLEECCIIHPGARVESGRLWKAYRAWCEEKARKPAFNAAHNFTRELYKRDGIESVKSNNVRYVSGLGLQHEDAGTPRYAKDTLSENSPCKPPCEEVLENSDSAYLSVPVTMETQPAETCSNCGGIDWRHEPLSRSKWVCKTCSYAKEP